MKKLKKPMAMILAAALAFTLMPEPQSVVKAGDLPTPTAHYDMSHTGNQLTDVSGNNRHATLYNTEEEDFKSGGGMEILQFANKQYAELPQGLVTDADNDFTVEITLSAKTEGNYWAWTLGQGVGQWGAGNIGDYFFMAPKSAQGGYNGKILSGIKVGSESAGGEKRFPASEKGLGAGYNTVTLVSEGDTVTIYLDGEKVSEGTHTYDLSTIIPDSGAIGYIAKSLYAPDALMTANVGDIKFYDTALTEEQVAQSMPTADEKATMQAVETGTVIPGGDSGSELIASYDMSHSGNVLTDVSGKGNSATLYNTEEADFLSGGDEKIWSLDGQSYATLPSSIADDLGDSEDFTVQATLTTQKAAAHWLFVIGDGFGTWSAKSVGNYIFVNPCASEKGGNFLSAIKTGTGNAWKETRFSDSSTGMDDVNGYGTVTLTGKGGVMNLYLDGELVSTVTQDKTIQDVLSDGEIFGYIGMSLYEEDPLLTAGISRFEIYSGALTQQEIKDRLPQAEEKSDMLWADVLETVKGENISLDAVTEDLSLPSRIDNVEMTWGTWEETNVIAQDGKVTQAAAQTEVQIPVTYQIDGKDYSREIQVTVLPLDVEAELARALASLDIPNKDDVRGNITLPEETENGIAIVWSTDRDDIINVEAVPATVAGYDETPAGTVTRPEKDTTVTMKATLTLEGASVSKDIEIHVKAAPETIEESDYTDYFFAYFAGEGYADGEQIYFASSQDGLNWDNLKNNEPVLTSTLGEQGVRDPFIIRSPEGDKFYLIATDLKIYGGNGWTAAQENGSQCLMVWESTDLVNWSKQRMVEVSASIDAGCTWAPEATYDPLTGEYVVYWASKVAADNYSKQRIYYAKTRDFYTFTEPEVYIDYDQSSIDTTILFENGKYYRYTKNEGGATNQLGAKTKTIFSEVSDTLLGSFTHIASPSLNNNPWVEGPTIFKLNEDDRQYGKYCLLVDDFGGRGYYPLITDDLDSAEFSTPSTAYKMPSRARHGTPIRITSEEYQNIMSAYATPNEVNLVTYAGETPKFPDTVTVDIGDQQIEKAVTWNLDSVSFDGELFSFVTVTGTVEDSIFEAVAKIRILPKDMEYFIDCNNPDSGTWKETMNLSGNLLNAEAADQAKTDENTWGYTSVAGSVEPADITGYSQNDLNNPYIGGWWARKDKDITYQVTLPAGEHTIYLGCTGWWNMGRQMDVYYAVDGGEEIKLCDLDAVSNSERCASGKIVLEEKAVVTLTVKKADGNDPILSWIAVSGKETLPPVDRQELEEEVTKAEAITADGFTEESWENLQNALAAARAVLENSASTQEDVQRALDDLTQAIDDLEEKQESGAGDDGQTGDDGKTEDDGQSGAGSQTGNKGDSQKTPASADKTPQTGDASHPLLPAAAAAAALTVVAVLLNRKRRA